MLFDRERDTGGLSTHERISRIEREQGAIRQLMDERAEKMWKKISELEVSIGANSTRLILLFFLLSLAAQWMMKKYG